MIRAAALALALALALSFLSAAASPADARTPDSKQLEKALQSLDWPQFRSVVESIPKLKADVEAYGPAGWKFVQAKYKTHAWRKNIERLDEAEKKRLADLIRRARKAR